MTASRARTAASVGVFVLFSAVLLPMLTAQARAKPLWHDEIYTVLFAGLPTVGSMWTAARDGIDLAPPLNALATRAVFATWGQGPIAVRLPPIAGYWLMSALLFEFVRRRAGVLAALAAALLPALTAAFRFSIEARGYGLMLAFFTAAIFFWAEAARGRARGPSLAMMTAAIAAGLWNQYWAVLVFVPLGVGELVRLMRSRRADWPMWMAMAAALALAAPLRPLMQVASAQSATFWRHASLSDVTETYQFLFEPLSDARFRIAAVAIVAAVAARFLVPGRLVAAPDRSSPDVLARLIRRASVDVTEYEAAAIAASVLVPLVAVLLGVFVTGVFVPRYALPAIIGLSLGLPLAIAWCGSIANVAPLVLCGVLLWTFAETAERIWSSPPPFRDPMAGRSLLLQHLSSGTPVVVSGNLIYLQLWYYTPQPQRPLLTYLADPSSALKYTRSNTIDLGYQALHRWTAVGALDYDGFVSGHRQFLVYAIGSGWLLDRLRDDHATLEEAGREAGATLYRVSLVK